MWFFVEISKIIDGSSRNRHRGCHTRPNLYWRAVLAFLRKNQTCGGAILTNFRRLRKGVMHRRAIEGFWGWKYGTEPCRGQFLEVPTRPEHRVCTPENPETSWTNGPRKFVKIRLMMMIQNINFSSLPIILNPKWREAQILLWLRHKNATQLQDLESAREQYIATWYELDYAKQGLQKIRQACDASLDSKLVILIQVAEVEHRLGTQVQQLVSMRFSHELLAATLLLIGEQLEASIEGLFEGSEDVDKYTDHIVLELLLQNLQLKRRDGMADLQSILSFLLTSMKSKWRKITTSNFQQPEGYYHELWIFCDALNYGMDDSDARLLANDEYLAYQRSKHLMARDLTVRRTRDSAKVPRGAMVHGQVQCSDVNVPSTLRTRFF